MKKIPIVLLYYYSICLYIYLYYYSILLFEDITGCSILLLNFTIVEDRSSMI